MIKSLKGSGTQRLLEEHWVARFVSIERAVLYKLKQLDLVRRI